MTAFPVDDHDLMERLRGGDEAAFDAIFRAWYAPLVRMAQSMLRDRSVAEELAQDVMLELWRRRESLSLEGSAQAYLFRSIRNRVLNHLRHLRVEQRSEADVENQISREASAPAQLVEEEIDVALRRAVAGLPERCREVFEMSRVHNLKYTEIAQTLGISVKTVEAQMGKALRLLREKLEPWLGKRDGGRETGDGR